VCHCAHMPYRSEAVLGDSIMTALQKGEH
jgi:hypothetical protein